MMGSLDGEQNGGANHTPFYLDCYDSNSRMSWAEEGEEENPSSARSFLGFTELSRPDVCTPINDRSSIKENPWLLKTTEPPPATPEKRPAAPIQTNIPLPGMEVQVEEHYMEQVQTMVVKEVLKDIHTACKLLNIPPDPLDWSCEHVQKWLLWSERLYTLPHTGLKFEEMCGRDLCFMTEADFRQRSSLVGDTLYAHLDIWRFAAAIKMRHEAEESKSAADEAFQSDETFMYPNQPIQLWQFLRQLLLKPHNYSNCIRWLNKEKGVFKIQDSAHVARLWGLRKNRPAMNYDKLSRSIRQYYKKGIIRKPEHSGRLVYQFVIPE